MNGAKRLEYFDMAKGIGIILVVLAHIQYINEILRTWIVSFHMPLFFIVSGMLLCYRKEQDSSLPELIKRKSSSILIPYVCFSLCYLLIDIFRLLFLKSNITVGEVIQHAVDAVTMHGVSVLWFLTAAFIGELLFFLLAKYLSKKWMAAAAFAAIAFVYGGSILLKSAEELYAASYILITLIHAGQTLLRGIMAFAFMTGGYFIFPLLSKTQERSYNELWTGIFLVVINIFLSQLNGGVDLNFLVFHNIFLYVICAVTGSMGIILICKNSKPLKLLSYYGKNSLIVMVTHLDGYILYMAIVISFAINEYVTRAKSYIFCLSIMVIVFAVEWIIIEVINRYFYFLMGRTSRGIQR